MGLDIIAYSKLAFLSKEIPEDYDGSQGVLIESASDSDFNRLGSLKPGLYAQLTLADLWWSAEHDFDGSRLPDSERGTVDQRVKELLLNGTAGPESTKGDRTVLANPNWASQEFSFRAGSYSGYNAWRQRLCRLALGVDCGDVWDSPDLYAGKPFVELIDFSDSNGFIGPEASSKLRSDFVRFAGEVEKGLKKGKEGGNLSEDDEWFAESYRDWQKAFSLAADGGVVIFC